MLKMTNELMEYWNDLFIGFSHFSPCDIREIIKEVESNPKIGNKEPVPDAHLLKVNAFFLAQFVRYAHRPAVFLSMPRQQYMAAKKTKPIVTSGVLGH